MGLSGRSIGKNAFREDVFRKDGKEKRIALAGNPNVGKSTVFNALTGLHQHTGNWTGKTVTTAVGQCKEGEMRYEIADLPGVYSLAARSAEEQAARDFLCFGGADAVVVVCDVTRLARNLGLVYQIMEITPRVLVCLNLMDEAKRNGMTIHAQKLSSLLGLPVVTMSAGRGEGVRELLRRLPETEATMPLHASYPSEIEQAISDLMPMLEPICRDRVDPRFAALCLLEDDATFAAGLNDVLEGALFSADRQAVLSNVRKLLREKGYTREKIAEALATSVMKKAEEVAKRSAEIPQREDTLCRADRILMSRAGGIPMMIVLLALVFWITIVGANYPSSFLSKGFHFLEPHWHALLLRVGCGDFLADMLTYGLYRVMAWIVSVMLPPMAIFFPLFTFLEDVGYLPRVAFNLDGMFSRCDACGKQGLTMCMGLGCNAAGVVGARIIDSKRERLLAILTNNFMPCNGRFPAIIAVSSIFFSGIWGAFSVISAFVCAVVILIGIAMTWICSKLLSRTVLRGECSSFILELPPYRKPQIGKILIRSVLDRTIFVLGRAVAVAAPAGIFIWLLSHIYVGDCSLTSAVAQVLDPIGRAMGLDGVILLAFLLGIPANEIVLPLCVMLYLSSGTLSEIGSLSALSQVLCDNGWTWATAISFLLFSVMHWPCATTLLTVKKETGRWYYVLLSFLIPTVCGVISCMIFHSFTLLFP